MKEESDPLNEVVVGGLRYDETERNDFGYFAYRCERSESDIQLDASMLLQGKVSSVSVSNTALGRSEQSRKYSDSWCLFP